MGRAEQELVDDTFRVLSIGFSYLDGPESVSKYFGKHGARPYSFIVYTNLGDLYLEQERYQDAADAYHAFVELDPYHAKAPLLQVEVIEAFKKGGFADLVLDGKENFVETYGPGSPYWQRFTFEQQPEVVAHLKSNVTDLAAYHHSQAQKTHDAASTRPPRAGTGLTCSRSPTTRTPRETNFLLAEVLYESGNYRDAAVEYERTAYAYPFHAHAGEAGYAALLAYAKQEERLEGAAKAQWHRAAHRERAAVRRHVSDARAGRARADRRGREALRARRLRARARRRAGRGRAHAAGRADAAAHGVDGARALGVRPEGLRRRRDRVRAPEHADAGERPAARRDRRAHRVVDLQAGRAGPRRGRLDVAVSHFLRVGQAAPTSPIRATAEYDAAAALIQMGDWPRATTVLEDFRRNFPNHALAPT